MIPYLGDKVIFHHCGLHFSKISPALPLEKLSINYTINWGGGGDIKDTHLSYNYASKIESSLKMLIFKQSLQKLNVFSGQHQLSIFNQNNICNDIVKFSALRTVKQVPAAALTTSSLKSTAIKAKYSDIRNTSPEKYHCPLNWQDSKVFLISFLIPSTGFHFPSHSCSWWSIITTVFAVYY